MVVNGEYERMVAVKLGGIERPCRSETEKDCSSGSRRAFFVHLDFRLVGGIVEGDGIIGKGTEVGRFTEHVTDAHLAKKWDDFESLLETESGQFQFHFTGTDIVDGLFERFHVKFAQNILQAVGHCERRQKDEERDFGAVAFVGQL